MPDLPSLDDLVGNSSQESTQSIPPQVTPVGHNPRGRKAKEEYQNDEPTVDDQYEQDELDKKSKDELWDILTSNLSVTEFDKLINKYVINNMGGKGSGKQSATIGGKMSDPFEPIKNMYANKIQVHEMRDMVREMLNGDNKKKDEKDEPEEDNVMNTVAQVAPFLQATQGQQGQSNNGGFDMNKLIDILPLLQGSKSSNNNPMMLLSLLKLFTNNNAPQQQQNPQVINDVINEIKLMMAQQNKPNDNSALQIVTALLPLIQGQNQKKDDTSTQAMITFMNSIVNKMDSIVNTNQTQQSQNILTAIEKFGEKLAGSLQNDPVDSIREQFQLFRELASDKRERSKDELDFELKKKELDLKESEKIELLKREERAEERENDKSTRILDTVGTVLDKITGEGTRAIMSEVFKARGQKNRKGNVNNEVNDLGGAMSADDAEFL